MPRGSDPVGGPAPRPPLLRPADWLVVATVGLVVFVVGVYEPATSWIHGPLYYGTSLVAVAIAILGGVVFGLGLSKWYDLRPGGPAERNRPPPSQADLGIRGAPSFEVYRPAEPGEERRPQG